MRLLTSAAGKNGTLELFEDKLCIKRSGFIAFMSGLKGDKDILVSQISSIQFKKANLMVNGFIQFAFLGGKEAKGGTFQAATDENTVMFTTGQQADFEAFKTATERQMAVSRKPSATTVTSSPLDDLEKLAALRDKGIITEDEFTAKKRQLLKL